MICDCESFAKDKAAFFHYSLCVCVWGFEETTGNTQRTIYSFQYETEAHIGSKNTVAVVY